MAGVHTPAHRVTSSELDDRRLQAAAVQVGHLDQRRMASLVSRRRVKYVRLLVFDEFYRSRRMLG